MKHSIKRFAAATAIAAVSLSGLAACSSDDNSKSSDKGSSDKAASDNGSSDNGSTEAGSVSVELKEYEIIPDEIEAAASGGKVTFAVKNTGTLEHDFTVEGYEDQKIAINKAGDSASGSMTLAPGEYVTYCSVPGHRDMGMEGTMTVK